MKKIILFTLIVVSLSIGNTSSEAEAPAPVVVIKPTVRELITLKAKEYKVSEAQLLGTLKCESNLNPKAIGDGGNSFGVAQIHLPSHKDITREQAVDPEFAIDWTAKMFSQGEQRQWTCWRMLYKKTT